jgi:hypothetical protein
MSTETTMGTSDGSVGGVVKIADHGPDNARWNLVVLAEGYRAGELAKYHTDAQNFVDRLRATPPFDELWCGINVHRVDVTSTDSGADDPTDCAGGTGATPRTYFDATFCSAWGGTRLDRLLTVDSTSAKSVARSRVPLMHQTLVIVSSSKYGGSGGEVATCSTNSRASEIAIHEMGHSAFGLADEYENGGNATGTEPFEPNVTLDSNRATNKWRDLIGSTTPMPSSCYGDCPGCTPPTTPPPANAVGAYEGARYFHCGMYRPLPSCYMRDYSPFCPVCARVIRQTLQRWLPAESIALATPSISFTDIPEGLGGTGVTTQRAVVFNVVSCRRLTFRITSGPSGGFGTPFGTTVSLPPGGGYGPTQQARVWLSYTSTNAGDTASGSVTIRCDETSQTWTIPIHANTVGRPRSAVVLVLDRSGSMAEDAGDSTTKVSKLREAARIFVDAMLPGDGLGVVRFDDTVQRLMDVTDVGPLSTGTGRATAIGHINGSELDPAGATSIGGGVQEGKAALDAAVAPTPYAVKAILVLTDGVENTPPMLATVGSTITANTFAVGLGLPYNISTAALNTLTQGHNGYLLVTGALTTDQRTRLSKYFLQILAGITNASVILDPHGDIGFGEEHRIPFVVSDADYGLDAFLLTAAPWAIDYELETPDGHRIDPSISSLGSGEFVTGSGASFYRLTLPALANDPSGSHEGTWYAVLRLGEQKTWDRASYQSQMDQPRRTLAYDVLVHAYSNVVFRANAIQTSYEPGADVLLNATLREYDRDVEGSRASVWADVTQPNGTVLTTPLVAGSGQYIGSFKTAAPGLYTVRAHARGVTYGGSAFTREHVATAVALPGGDTPSSGDLGSPLSELLCCLLKSEALGEAFWGNVERSGIDADSFRRCLMRVCGERHRKQGRREGPTPGPLR